MMVPFAIKQLYEKMRQYSTTVVVVPQDRKIIRCYQSDRRTYLTNDAVFKISWPESWSAVQGVGQAPKVRLRCDVKNEFANPVEIYLSAENPPCCGWEDYYARCYKSVSATCKVVGSDYEDTFHTFTFLLLQSYGTHSLEYKIQKSFVFNDKAYTLQINGLRPDFPAGVPELASEISQIVQSFAFIKMQPSSPTGQNGGWQTKPECAVEADMGRLVYLNRA
jgi:hypothetical protein